MHIARLLLLLSALFAGFYAKAQDVFSKYVRTSLPENLSPQDYQRGMVLLKIKKEYRNAFFDNVRRRVNLFEHIPDARISTLAQPIVVEKALEKMRRQRGYEPKIDISLFYQLRFDENQMSIREVIDRLYQMGIVEIAEPYYLERFHYVPNDPRITQQYYLNTTKAFQAWDLVRAKKQTVIAIVDSGVDLDHPDLKDAIWKNPREIPNNKIDDDENGYIDDVNGWDFVGADTLKYYQSTNPADYQDNDPSVYGKNNFHGTAVAGCAAAVGDNNEGIAGVGFGASIMPLKCSADNDTRAGGFGFVMNQLEAVLYAANNGAHIINCSYGGTNRSEIAQQIYAYAVLEKNCLVVASAGNAGTDFNFPATYDYVLSVTSVDENDKTVGHTTNTAVDICAPGKNIVTTDYDDIYSSYNGTSFASPIVAGAAALIREKYPQFTGFQIGEILRVTADENPYKVNVLPRKTIGKGRMDIEKALTVQSPSVRMTNVKLINKTGGTAQAGDTATFIADFTNYLWATNNLEVSISVNNPNVRVIESTAKVGIIGTNETKSNAGSPFRIHISSTTPNNARIEFLINFKDGNYTDYQYYTIVINPTYLNFERNFISTTISGKGRIGYDGDSQKDGIGFIINGSDNLLYEMGLMTGTSPTKLVSTVRGTASGAFNDEYNSIQRIREIIGGEKAPFEMTGKLNDNKIPAKSSNVEITYRAMAWSYAPYQHFILLEYVVKNKNTSVLDNFHLGLYADWDVSHEGAKDKADWLAEHDMGYVYNFGDGSTLFAGLQVLTGKSNYYAIDNDHRITGNPLGVYDGFSDAEKYQTLSSGFTKTTAGNSSTGGDVSHTVGAGPYSIPANDSIVVAFALHGANSMNELIASANAAKQLYHQTFKAPKPLVSNVEVCYGATATIRATGATKFKWYASADSGTPIHEGDTYVTQTVKGDSVYYVSNADAPYESIRTKVTVKVKANPTVFVAGGEKICEGSQTVLSVGKADSYLWSTGATTQSITVKESGEYFVTVKDNALGCQNTSEKIKVTVLPTPKAQFTMSVETLDLSQSRKVKFTDQSTNAISWSWELGEGKTSTLQHPEVEYETFGIKTIRLTVTSEGGCTSTVSKTLVVTALEEDTFAQKITIYPNPTQSVFYVTSEAVNLEAIRLVDMLGQLIDVKVTNEGKSYKVDTSGVTSGVYYVQCIAKEGTAVKKLIIH